MNSQVRGGSGSIAGADPLLGRWRLNPARSSYETLVLPRSMTRTYVTTREGEVRETADEVLADGQSVHIEWIGQFDGRDYPATGAMLYDSAAEYSHSGVDLQAGRPTGGHRDERDLAGWPDSDIHRDHESSAGRGFQRRSDLRQGIAAMLKGVGHGGISPPRPYVASLRMRSRRS